jgi:hypothetical protein
VNPKIYDSHAVFWEGDFATQEKSRLHHREDR